MSNGITAENLLETLPEMLARDVKMMGLATGIAEILTARLGEIDAIRIYAAVETLPEELLDILAEDFGVSWWDSSYTLAEKRETFASSWYVHRHLGTKGAVEAALAAVYPGATVKEWFEYSGDPYHYKVRIDVTQDSVDPQRHARIMQRLALYANVRSVLDDVEYFDNGASAGAFALTAYVGAEIEDGATAS